MRAFIAAMLPDHARLDLEEQLRPLRSSPLAADLRWEEPHRWHLTLAFLGEVTPAVAAAIGPRLQRAGGRTEPLDLKIAGLGRFGGHLLYAKVEGDRAGLARLVDRVQAACRREHVPIPSRRFRAHVTVARARSPVDLRPLVVAGRDLAVAGWRVDEICLVESVLGVDRRYEVRQRFPLAGSV